VFRLLDSQRSQLHDQTFARMGSFTRSKHPRCLWASECKGLPDPFFGITQNWMPFKLYRMVAEGTGRVP